MLSTLAAGSTVKERRCYHKLNLTYNYYYYYFLKSTFLFSCTVQIISSKKLEIINLFLLEDKLAESVF